MQIRLPNGNVINLSELDKLENSSAEKGIGKYFDSVQAGGNGNSVFDKNEIERMKAFLIEAAGSDGILDENELSQIPEKYQTLFGTNAQMFADDLSMLNLSSASNQDTKTDPEPSLSNTSDSGSHVDEQTPEEPKTSPPVSSNPAPAPKPLRRKALPNDNSPRHLVQSGDTPKKIVAALGYTGGDAKKYYDSFMQQLEEDSSFMNEKKWLMAGSTIRLLSDDKLKELGLQKPENTTVAQVTPQTKTGETKSSKQENTNDIPESNQLVGAQKTSQKTPINKSSTNVVENSAERILETIKLNGQKGRIIKESELSENQKTIKNRQKNLYGVEPVLIKNDSTGEIHIFLDTKESQRAKKLGLTSIQSIIGKSEPIETFRYYKNGKIAKDLEYKDNKKNTSILIKKPNKTATSKKVIMQALPIDITVDPSVYTGASKSQRQEIDDFVNTLKTQKASLMKDLNLDNDEYNRLAKMSLSIAMQETNFGKCDSYNYWDGTFGGAMVKDTAAVVGIVAQKVGVNAKTAVSKGLTQVKVGDWDDDPRLAKLFSKYGINRGYYNTLDGKQSAAATMIVLNELAKKVKKPEYQNGIEAAKDKYIYVEKYLKDGKVVSGKVNILNNVTEEDGIMYLYNGSPGALKKGAATPSFRLYTHNIRRYNSLFQIKEDPKLRANALKQARIVNQNPEQANPMNKDLGWGIGQIAFMPKLYTGGIRKNSNEEINKLQVSMLSKGFDIKACQKLTDKLKNGELSFAYGLGTSEIEALTQEDVDLLLEYSDKLNTVLSSTSDESKKRSLASNIDKEFKREYLASHAKQVYYKDVAKSSVLLIDPNNKNVKPYPSGGYKTGAQQRCTKYLTQLRGEHKPGTGVARYNTRRNNGLYMGFDVEADKGINYNNASKIDILLAQNAADSANTLKTSGACCTGVKQGLIGSGAVTAEEMRTFNNAFQLAKFLEKHPNRFTEIKYVQISDDVAREITAADVSRLPAGYIVVYGNAARMDVPGHNGVSNGNEQLAADEFDNANWDNFAAKDNSQNGKGEHGYFRVFKLNPDYYTVDASGKKLIKK